MIGKTIGKYRIVEKLGRGGMGTVYKAVDETLDREVAIKVLNPELGDSDVMKRFRAEATTLAKLNHPEIATIFEIHRSDADLLMVMELVRGETLDQLSQRCGPLPPERAAYLVAQVLGALEHAHRAGIVHRDLKPANVMVTELGGVKIMDFGIARVLGAEHLTNDGYMMGTPAYMAPEQVLGQEVDGRADVYSVGVVFYRLLTANLPFQADTAIGMVQKQLSDVPTPAHLHRAGLPNWCQAILDRALAKSPADRFQTAEEFRAVLLTSSGAGTTENTSALPAAGLTGTTPVRPVSVPQATATPATALPAGVPQRSGVQPQVASAVEGATIVLRKNHFAVGGALLAVLAVGVGVLAFVALRRPTAVVVTGGAPAASTTPAPVPPGSPLPQPASPAAVSTPPPTAPPVVSTPAAPASAAASTSPSPAPPSSASPATTPPKAARPARAPSTGASTAAGGAASTAASGGASTASGSASRSATTHAPVAPAAGAEASSGKAEPPHAAKAIVPPFVFDAKALVQDGNKRRERDAKVLLADGTVTVTTQNHDILNAVPYGAVLTVSYSNSKQPLWNSPDGPAVVVRADGGAFGFLKGGRHWVSLRTKDSFVVLRVDADQARRVLSALEERTGLTAEHVAERKDDK